ncbi:MAG: hypothetical protein OXP73_08975 [Chloroflexota bacterium]|nr:hypothetical protein [Chloroflexota bacterium]
MALALGPATLTAQVTSGFGQITVLSSTFLSAPGNATLQHNVPRLSVTVGAETLTADFQDFFERTGGLQRWGFPTSEVHVEETGTLTQYYQRGVVDFHRRVDLGNIYVLERRLTWDYFGGGQGGSPDLGVEPGTVNNNTGEQLGPWNHKVSNFSVGGVRTGFLDFFNAFGGVQAFGFPKTEARVDTNAPGTVHIAAATAGFTRQYFQAAVMEHHPQDPQAPVKLRLLGDDLRNQKYPANAWAQFEAFGAAVPLAAGQVYTPQVIEFTAPSTSPTAVPTATATAGPTTSPGPTQLSGELIVVGTTDGGILLYDGATWRQLDKDNSVLSTNRVQAVLVDRDGQIWAGTDAGLFRLNRDGQGVAYNQANTNREIGSDNIAALAGLRTTDVLWMAHPQQGVSGFDGDSWERFRSDNSLMPSSEVRALRLIPGTAGGLMFATAGGAVLYDHLNDDWYIYNTGNSGIVSDNVTAVAVDTRGGLWFGTVDGGVSRTRNPLTWDHFDAGEGLGSNNVRDIFVASDGTVWVATSRGVSWLQDNLFSTSNVLNAGLPSNSVRTLAEDSQGHIWIATDGGVGSFDGSTWTAFTTAQGLPTNNASSIAVGRVVGS